MNVATLREATAQDHEAVEDAVPLMDPHLDRALYIAVLTRMYGVVAAWEQFAETAAPEALKLMIRDRQRKSLLEQDLKYLGAVPSTKRPELPAWTTAAELLGAMYVMEGSRLGGQLIARHVEHVLGLTATQGSAYFRGFGDRTGLMWKELITLLESSIPPEEEEAAIRAAKEMFAIFGTWMQGLAVPPPVPAAFPVKTLP